MYVILGCDEIGSALARNLSKAGEEVIVIDSDEASLVKLKELNLRTTVADVNTLDFDALPAKDAIAFVLLQKSYKDNLAFVKRVKKLFPDKFILSRSVSENEASGLLENGADRVVQTVGIVTNTLQNELEAAKLKRNAFRLVSVIKATASRGLAIFLQDNPDPDAIASGLALKRIAEKYGVASQIYYGGNIGYQQNKTMVSLLKADLIQLKTADESRAAMNTSDKVALIEASIPSKNNILPVNTTPNIVIDHHQTDFYLVKGEFIEILPKIGATSTIMTRYMRQLGIIPDPPLATALRYGIRVDTGGFTRNTSTEDLDAAAYLSPLVDVSLLKQIEDLPMSAETLDIIGRAIQNREIRGSYLVSFVEYITDRDSLPQAAELLLQLDSISTVLVFGIHKNKVQLSARSVDSSVNLALLLQKAFGFMNAGGHATMAAGSIDLGSFGNGSNKALLKITLDTVREKFFSVVGVDMEKREIPNKLELIINNSTRN